MAERKRIWVKVLDSVRKRMLHLAIDADAKSVEEFAGDLLAEAVERAERIAAEHRAKDRGGRPPTKGGA